MDKETRASLAQAEYKQKKREIVENDLVPPGILKAKLYYPLTKFLLRAITVFEHASIVYLNEIAVQTPQGRPIIYACTHKFKPDIEKITLSLNRPSFLVASDLKNSYQTINGWYFGTRPTVFVDPYDKTDKHYTYQMMLKYLNAGFPCMIFPDAVWNLSENRMILDCFFGTVRAALETNAVIVCIAIERYGKQYIINRNGYLDPAKIVMELTGASYQALSEEEKKRAVAECNRILRDTMATLMMEIWLDHAEKYGIEKSAELPRNYWEDFLDSLTAEWSGYKMSDNEEQQFHSRAELAYREVQQTYRNLKPNWNNAFLWNKRLK